MRTIEMETEEGKESSSIWVHWERKVISFREAEDFTELTFPTHEEMFQFAIEKGSEGYGIQ